MTQIDWDLVTRHLAGTSTPSERQWIERMAAAHPEIADLLAATHEISRDGDSAVPVEALATRLEAVKREAQREAARAPEHPVAPRFTLPRPTRAPLAVAAGLALLAGGGTAWLALRHTAAPTAETPAYSVVSTALGQRLSLRLSDSSLVLLAPGSTFRTRADYGRQDRVVELEGEALFTVVHDSTRPFAVHTPRAVATDLGTRFIVRAYVDDPLTDIVVAEGQVAVRPADSSQVQPPSDSLILNRGERARVAGDGRVQFSRKVSLEDYLDWTEGKLRFRGTPLGEAARRLERWYDIEIRLAPAKLADRPIVAAAEDEPATDVLATIAASLDLRLYRAGRVYTLTAN